MKRLKYYLVNMENDTHTYKEMYEGKVYVEVNTGTKILEHLEEHYDAVYWDQEIGYSIEMTHKMKKDMPTVLIQIPCSLLKIERKTVGAADCCLRQFVPFIKELNDRNANDARSAKENGQFNCYMPGGEVLLRNSVFFQKVMPRDYEYLKGNNIRTFAPGDQSPAKSCLCIRIQVQLPEKKLKKAIQMLCKDLPDAVNRYVEQFSSEQLDEALKLETKQLNIRKWLMNSDYCAFVANGSILPREKGGTKPARYAIPFSAPKDCQIEVEGIVGMGIRKGVTVITGGGYSGKSTLLEAIAAGVYNHYLGDGREFVLSDENSMKITAEDGRSVQNVNVAPFIGWIPNGCTQDFSTEHASGSTSQAANIMEAVNSGSKVLLIDEDKSATNFMIRDQLMKKLIASEPIIPFTDRVRELHTKMNVSTILVIGGSGEYLRVADYIYLMEDFLPVDVTSEAKKLGESIIKDEQINETEEWEFNRLLIAESFHSRPGREKSEKLEIWDRDFIFIGNERIDTRMLHHVVTTEQNMAIGFLIRKLMNVTQESKLNLENMLDQIYQQIDQEGLDVIFSNYFLGCSRFLDLPRKEDVLNAIYRMRKITFECSK